MNAALISLLGVALAAVVGLVSFELTQFGHRLDRLEDRMDGPNAKLTARMDSVESKLSSRIEGLHTKLSARIDAVGSDVSGLREELRGFAQKLDSHITDHPEPGRRA